MPQLSNPLLVCCLMLAPQAAPTTTTTSTQSKPIVLDFPVESDGRIDIVPLAHALARATGVTLPLSPSEPNLKLRLPVYGPAGAPTRAMLAQTLGPDLAISVTQSTLSITCNPVMLNKENLATWKARITAFAERARREAQLGRNAYGMHVLDSFKPNDPTRPTIVLIHGMNSASGCFLHMVPRLEEAGYGILLYDYPDNQDLDTTLPQFRNDWNAARTQTGDHSPWIILGHSMGTLLARDYVEGDHFSQDVSSLILIAPPNQGSALAKAQGLVQMLQNMGLNRGAGSMLELGEGLGEAAQDLLPGSAFLKKLNARPRRSGVNYFILAGDRGFLTREMRKQIDARFGSAGRFAGVFGKLAQAASTSLSEPLDELTDGTGDGAVALGSTMLEGVDEYRVLHANHVELIRGPMLYPEPGPIACMPQVLAWLKQAQPPRDTRD